MNTDTRYPYTHACDYLREVVGRKGMQTIISRADASKIRRAIAQAIGADDYEVACKLADAFLARQDSASKAKDPFKNLPERIQEDELRLFFQNIDD